MENRGLKTIIAINLFDVTMGSYDGAEIFADKNGCSFHLKPSRKNVWQGKHRSAYIGTTVWQSSKTDQHVWQTI